MRKHELLTDVLMVLIPIGIILGNWFVVFRSGFGFSG